MIPTVPILEALAVAGMLAVAPATIPPTPAATGAPVVLKLDAGRLGLVGGRDERRGLLRVAARLGAALAWDLADLPRHQARFPEPIGGFDAGAGFACGALSPPRAHGSEAAIDVLIRRWNTIYPPYALPQGCKVTNDH
jgi:hypothetical protein